jgi:hypothetical protein
VDINSEPDPEERLFRFYAVASAASAALGVLSLCTAVIPALGCVMGAVGILVGIYGRKSDRKTVATVGISLSIIGAMTAILYSFLVYFSEYSMVIGKI